MYFGFDFYRDDSIEDLDERLKKINSFLADYQNTNKEHRHFGVFLLSPKKSSLTVANKNMHSRLIDIQSKNNYILCFEFYNPDKGIIPSLELIYDLGPTPELYNSLKSDVAAVSYLCAYPAHEHVSFIKSEKSLSILFKFMDDDPNIKRIKNHLEFLIPNMAQM